MKKIWGAGLISEKAEVLYVELNERDILRRYFLTILIMLQSSYIKEKFFVAASILYGCGYLFLLWKGAQNDAHCICIKSPKACFLEVIFPYLRKPISRKPLMGNASKLVCLKSLYISSKIWRQPLELLQWINNHMSFQVKGFFQWNVQFNVLLFFLMSSSNSNTSVKGELKSWVFWMFEAC